MKTLGIIACLIMLSIAATAGTPGKDFVIADGVYYDCAEIHRGFSNTTITTTDGEKVKVPNFLVQSFRQHGRQYELLPLVNGKGDTVAMTYMELIACHNGCSLYRYCTNCNKYDPLSGEIAPMNHIYRYFVLKNGKISLLHDDATTCDAMAFFNVRVIK
ncbi:MAG TPA: hypothetical protein PK796_07980 [Bacteroidales bacterium]|nr:hypothetical protein [Bacteroidales bacterium]